MTTRLAPVSAGLTRIENSLVHEGAIESEDYDPEEVDHVWKMTSEQDWELCENNYAGIKSLAYEPRPFSEMTETSVESFLQWYLDQLAEEPDSSLAQPYSFSLGLTGTSPSCKRNTVARENQAGRIKASPEG